LSKIGLRSALLELKNVLQIDPKNDAAYYALGEIKPVDGTFAKRPLLPNPGACPVECEAYSSGVRLKF